jgi:hypothetical protein
MGRLRCINSLALENRRVYPKSAKPLFYFGYRGWQVVLISPNSFFIQGLCSKKFSGLSKNFSFILVANAPNRLDNLQMSFFRVGYVSISDFSDNLRF